MEIIPLECLKPGEWADVEDISGEPLWISRLAEMGFRAGCRMCLLQMGSPCLIQLNGCRLSLRAEKGAQILVRPLSSSESMNHAC